VSLKLRAERAGRAGRWGGALTALVAAESSSGRSYPRAVHDRTTPMVPVFTGKDRSP
jgi:hypothetical protein